MSIAKFNEVKEIPQNRFSDCSLSKLNENKIVDKPMAKYDKPLAVICDNMKNYPIDNGRWDNERGNSKWRPDPKFIPGKANPEGKQWSEILNKYKTDSIPFKDGEPNFSKMAKETVEIKAFSASRTDNFDKADIALAKKNGGTPEAVSKWRKENGYTWHECKDMKTMQQVPSVVHNNITHSGGISEAKKGKGDNV